MADEKLSELTPITTPVGTDLLYIVRGDGASPETYTSYQTTLEEILIPAGVIPFELEVAVSDETTNLTTGDGKITFYWPAAVTLTEVFTGLSTQSSSGSVTIDVRENGTTIFTTPPSIEANEDTSLTGTPAVLNVTGMLKADKMIIDIDAAGTGAKGLKVVFRGTRA